MVSTNVDPIGGINALNNAEAGWSYVVDIWCANINT
jgi:hypothetical protein